MSEEANEDVEFKNQEEAKDEAKEDEIDLDDEAYSYIKSSGFTSEIFKIEIQNLPKYLSHIDLKRLFINKFKLTPKKVRVIKGFKNRSSYGYVTFANEADREKAIAVANNFVFKKCTLRVSKGKPIKDPAFDQKNKKANDNQT